MPDWARCDQPMTLPTAALGPKAGRLNPAALSGSMPPRFVLGSSATRLRRWLHLGDRPVELVDQRDVVRRVVTVGRDERPVIPEAVGATALEPIPGRRAYRCRRSTSRRAFELVRARHEHRGAVVLVDRREIPLLARPPGRLRCRRSPCTLDDAEHFVAEPPDRGADPSVGSTSSMASWKSAAIAWYSFAPCSSAIGTSRAGG